MVKKYKSILLKELSLRKSFLFLKHASIMHFNINLVFGLLM